MFPALLSLLLAMAMLPAPASAIRATSFQSDSTCTSPNGYVTHYDPNIQSGCGSDFVLGAVSGNPDLMQLQCSSSSPSSAWTVAAYHGAACLPSINIALATISFSGTGCQAITSSNGGVLFYTKVDCSDASQLSRASAAAAFGISLVMSVVLVLVQ